MYPTNQLILPSHCSLAVNVCGYIYKEIIWVNTLLVYEFVQCDGRIKLDPNFSLAKEPPLNEWYQKKHVTCMHSYEHWSFGDDTRVNASLVKEISFKGEYHS